MNWCAAGLASTIDAPRIYKLERLPRGPLWSDVQRLLVASSGDTPNDIRDHAMLLLLAVYGFAAVKCAISVWTTLTGNRK